MAINAENNGNSGNYEIVPSGTFPARCYSMIEIGTVTSTWEGESKQAKKVRITFELPTETRVFDPIKGEQPFSISREFTLSMHEKATLRKFLEGWRGKAFTEEEARKFDVTKLLGAPGFINVIHSTKGDKTYANINSVSPLPKAYACPDQINPTTVLSYDGFDFDVFNALPQFLQDKISGTPEYGKIQAALAAQSRTVQPMKPQEQPTVEDDLPF